MRKFILFFVVVACTLQGKSQVSDSILLNSISYIDTADLKKIVYRLAAPEMEGRETGSEGIVKASKLIIDSLKAYNIEYLPALKDYAHVFSLISLRLAEPLVQIGGYKCVAFKDYFGAVSSMTGKVAYSLVVVQNRSLDFIQKLYLDNKIILILTSDLYFPKKDLYSALIRKGCLGVILCNPSNKKEFESLAKILSASKQKKKDKLKLSFTGSISKTDSLIKRLKYIDYYQSTIVLNSKFTAKLFGMKEKEFSEKFSTKAIDSTFLNKSGMYISVSRDVLKKEETGANVIGFIKGAEKPNEAIVISAHYDHLGVENGQIKYGADDNASGVAAVLEIAQAYSNAVEKGYKPKRSIVFVAFSGEEKGLWGSRAFVNDIENLNIKPIANINLDMIGRGEDSHLEKKRRNKKVYAIAHKRDSVLINQIRSNFSSADSLFIDYSSTDLYSSDQASFITKNIPAVMFFRGLHSDYHTERDTPDKLDYKTMERIARLVFKISWEYVR